MKLHSLLLILPIVLAASCNTATKSNHTSKKIQKKTESNTEYKAGDIVFQESNSLQCEAVKAATGSRWSHCGILLPRNGKLQVMEAVQPVQWESIEDWKARGNGGVMKVKRLKADSLLTDEAINKMVNYGEKWIGENYDIYFNWSDDEWYCSELVWKIYDHGLAIEVGQRKPLKDYNLTHPIVKEIMKQRYGTSPPLDEMMISPGAIFDYNLLKEVELDR